MTTSGLAFAIHSLDFSKPEKTRFQYGSSVFFRSIAAPMAGTCDEVTPAMILATFRPCFLVALRNRPGRGFDSCLGSGFAGRLADRGLGRGIAPRFAAVALDRTAAGQHHLGIVFLGRAGHYCRDVLE